MVPRRLISCSLGTGTQPHLSSIWSTTQTCQGLQVFRHLASSSLHDFKARQAAAWTAIRRLNRISTALSTQLKLRLFDSLVVSILLYIATTWTMNKTLSKALTSGITVFSATPSTSPGMRQPTNEAIYMANHLQPITTILRLGLCRPLLSKLQICPSTGHGRPFPEPQGAG